MRKKIFLTITFLVVVLSLRAQTLKTDVIVVGQGNAAWAAGLQAAESGVKTTIVIPSGRFELAPVPAEAASGIAARWKARLQQHPELDTSSQLKKWADSTGNLQLIFSSANLKISRAGANWVLKLSNGQSIKAKVLVNASAVSIKEAPHIMQAFQPLDLQTKRYRTSIAAGDEVVDGRQRASILTLASLLPQMPENYVHLSGLSQSLAAGQAGGAVAAYAAFFKTKTSKTNLKAIQGELLNFKQALMPIADLPLADSNWRAIQVMALMGVFNMDFQQEKLFFHSEQQASFRDIETAISAFYYKAPIWFEDHPQDRVTLDLAISLICYVGNKSVDQVKKDTLKRWKTGYAFQGTPAEDQGLTRRQLAVLLYDHLQLFDIGTDHQGSIIK